MSGLVFVDTGLLLAALDRGDARRHHAARAWREELWRSRRGRTSLQVLWELYAAIERKRPAAREDARAEVADLLAWKPVALDAAVMERGWAIQDRCRIPFVDALVVAAAQASKCQYLLTEELPALEYEGILVRDPFVQNYQTLP